MYIITPAEIPREKERNIALYYLSKKAIALPIPVAQPAIRLSSKA